MIVTLKNGEELDFPDGTSPDKIKKYVYKNYGHLYQEKQETSQQTNQNPQENMGWQSVLQDALKGAKDVPSSIGNMITQLPSQAVLSGSQILTNPLRATENVGAGVLEGLKGLANTPYNVSKYLESKGILNNQNTDEFLKKYGGIDKNALDKFRNNAYIGDTGLQQKVLGDRQSGDELLQSIGSFAPYAKIGGLAKGLSGVAQRAGAAGLYAAGQNENPVTAAISMPATELAGNIAGKAIRPVYENLRPTVAFRGNLPIEEIQKNAQAAAGTNTPLGRILESPSLSSIFEKVTSHVPLSRGESVLNDIKSQVENRANQSLSSIKPQNLDQSINNIKQQNLLKSQDILSKSEPQNLNQAIENINFGNQAKAHDILNKIAPENVSGDLNDTVHDILKTAFKKEQKVKNNLYKERNALAEKEDHKLELPEFEKKATDVSDAIQKSPLYQNDPDFRKMYNKVSGYRDTTIQKKGPSFLDVSGNRREPEIIRPSVTEAQNTANKLYTEGSKLLSSRESNDRYIGGLYKDLSSTLRSDINKSVGEKGSNELIEAHENANKNYKEKFSPFLEKNMYKMVQEDKNPEKIVREIIKPSKQTDQYKSIQKVNNLLPDDKQNLLGYAHLKSSLDQYGNVNEKDFVSKIDVLGNRQLKQLIPDKDSRYALREYSKNYKTNEKLKDFVSNPNAIKNAKPEDIKSVNKLLPDDQKNLLGHLFLKTALDKHGNIDPVELAKVIKSTKSDNFRNIFNDKDLAKSLIDYSKAYPVNEKLNKFIENPKTIGSASKDTIEQVNKSLPKSQENLIGYTYLKSALGNSGKVNPKKLNTLITALKSNGIFESVFKDKNIRENLENYSRLRSMNEESLNVLFNPKTGARAIPTIQILGAAANPKAAIAGTAGAYLTNKLLTSQKVRENFINKIIENEQNKAKNVRTNKHPFTYLNQAYVGSQSAKKD